MRIALGIIAVLLAAQPAAAQLVASGPSLTVTTSNATATFAGPDLVGFVNTVTGESYLTSPSAGNLAAVNAIAGGGPLVPSNWTIGTEPGTGHTFASITSTATGRSLTLAVKIDPVSQEIVLRLQASISSPGLRDASWSIAGLDFDKGRLIVPAHSGVVFDRRHPGIGAYLQYPNTWQAQMAIYESALGSVVLYSTDQAMSFKQLRINTRGRSTVDVALATEAAAPFPSATVVPTVEWRLKAYSGDWRIAAETYRQWLLTNRPPVSNAAHPWVSNIRSVVLIAPDSTLLAPVAAQLVPAQTLLYVHDWRRDGYDVNYPDYTPRAGVAAFMVAARALGFRVMLHTDLPGVSSYSSDFPSVQAFQVKTPESLEPMGWEWQKPASTPYRFAYINPAAAAFRSLFIARLAPHLAALAPDAIHLDISAPMYNDGNGIIEGRNYPQGSAKLHEELIAAFPTIAFAGEGENDVLYRYHSFAQAWHLPVDGAGHPITTFLFSPQVLYYGHLSQPPARDPAMRRELMELEQRAVQPLLSVFGTSDVDTSDRDVARIVNILKAWQTHGFTPAWSAPWASASVRYQGLAGASAEFTETPTITSLTAAGTPLLQIAHDTDRLTTSSFVGSWPAFDNTTLYGLDRTQTYYLESLSRPSTTHLTSLPTGVQLGDSTMIGSSFARVEVEPAPAGTFDFTALIDARPGVRFSGVETPLGNGAVVHPSAIIAGGVSRPGLFVHPPWQGQVGGETFIEYSVAISAGSFLRFAVAVADNAECTDGVTFRVTIDGAERWSRHVLRTGWLEGGVDLAGYSGRTIALRLISHPGPANNPNCDWSQWSGVSIDAAPSASLIDVPIALAVGSSNAGFDGDGTLTMTSPTSATVRLPLPGAFTLFTGNGTAVSSGVNLANVPFSVWQAGVGALPRPGSAFGAGAIYTGSSGGVAKTPAIGAHPPTGRTILTWVTRLPAAQALKLSWSAGLADGGLSFDGVDFLVRVNGVTYWRKTGTVPQWMSGTIDLSRWKDKNVLIELVTDMRGSYWVDASHWADLVFTPADTTCSYGVPSAMTLGRDGGQLSVNVTTAAVCPWAAVSTVPWLTVTSGAGSGLGNGTALAVAAPNSGGVRTGTLVIAGSVVSITQDAALATPLSADDSYSTTRGAPLTIAAPGVLQNDDARGSGAMSATAIAPPSHGTLTLASNGGFTYAPDVSFVGTDSFTYQAVSGGGPGNVAIVTLTVLETTGPLPPTGLYLSAMSGNTLTVRFTAPASGPPTTGFVLEGGLTPGSVLASMPMGTDPIFTFTAPSGAFYIRVHTLSGAARSAASNEIRIFVNTPAAPSPPANLVGVVNQSSLALAWRNTFVGGAATSLILDVTGTMTTSMPLGLSDSFSFNGVPPGTYTLSLRAVNGAGTSSPSNAVTMTFPGACTGVPLAPANFLAYRIGATVFVVWDPATTGPAPTSYVLNVSGSFTGSFPTSGRTMSGSVGPGTYRLNVAAVNACGVSASTATQVVTIP